MAGDSEEGCGQMITSKAWVGVGRGGGRPSPGESRMWKPDTEQERHGGEGAVPRAPRRVRKVPREGDCRETTAGKKATQQR